MICDKKLSLGLNYVIAEKMFSEIFSFIQSKTVFGRGVRGSYIHDTKQYLNFFCVIDRTFLYG